MSKVLEVTESHTRGFPRLACFSRTIRGPIKRVLSTGQGVWTLNPEDGMDCPPHHTGWVTMSPLGRCVLASYSSALPVGQDESLGSFPFPEPVGLMAKSLQALIQNAPCLFVGRGWGGPRQAPLLQAGWPTLFLGSCWLFPQPSPSLPRRDPATRTAPSSSRP